MVRVFYNCKTNAFLGGELFLDGIKEFKKDTEGIEFAGRYHLKYEVIEVKKPVAKKATAKAGVK